MDYKFIEGKDFVCPVCETLVKTGISSYTKNRIMDADHNLEVTLSHYFKCPECGVEVRVRGRYDK